VPNRSDCESSVVTQTLVTPTAESAAQRAAELIDALLTERRETSRTAHIALAGGTTPRRCYEILVQLRDDWSGVHLWFGDERMVDLSSNEANAHMVDQALVIPADIADDQVHRVPTELGPAAACRRYEDDLRRTVPRGSSGLPQLDIVVLGLGEDAHTASLFPGSDALHVVGRACVLVEDAPKPPPVRVTLTMQMLNAASNRVLLVTGHGKAGAVAAARSVPTERVPASLLTPERTTWVLDAEAATTLDWQGGPDG
jgi:6-phosphogluconolactonase